MKRRDFIRSSVGAGVATGAALSLGGANSLLAAEAETDVDLVAIRGGEPEVMFDKGIAALGGMSRFVKPGQRVLVKPNIGWDRTPERAGNTNPKLVKRIVEHCLDAGAKEVLVFDHTCHEWSKCYKHSGIEQAVAEAGGKMVPGNSEKYYKQVNVKGGVKLKQTDVHELMLDTDVFINVPVLKNHSSSRATISMKNLMGCVWDRGYYHKNDLHQCIADFLHFRKPDLNVVDAYRMMKQNGPVGVSLDDVVTLKSQLISTDIVAADAAAAKFLGMDPAKINHIKIAAEAGFGTMDLSKLNIKRIVV
ncbi:DUF362 domain-containing protein [Prolixibacter denitrificans]|uniref:Uncharacterized protein (DUF362 family) n=1 Tax=Prolixibacter denitrificans TaxID=1541063 RepID=A0A2P8CL17_9BACT|nr:DUF362 domain-containing protein [Prolixibacter denitrificans]PSK85654.1 uncharacterized protein (DUF362 family) [Prolixibacter denitrificans]GET20274.1 hypothetical protein JCM18694_05200 [Prolixibacter denitrificans]